MRFIAAAPWLAAFVLVAICGLRYASLAKSAGAHPARGAAARGLRIPDAGAGRPDAAAAAGARAEESATRSSSRTSRCATCCSPWRARPRSISTSIPASRARSTLNAIDQTLKQILTRMARQVDMRWEQDGQTITVMPDTPYLRNYHIDYVNMTRDVSETVGISTQVISGSVGRGRAGRGWQPTTPRSPSPTSSQEPLLGDAREEHQGPAARDRQAAAARAAARPSCRTAARRRLPRARRAR